MARSQPSEPDRVAGDGNRSAGTSRRKDWIADGAIASALRDSGRPPVEIYQKRCKQADGQIDRHGDGDHLDGLSGDVEYASGKDLHQIGIANRDRERRVLDQVRYWLVSGGTITRIACGRTMSRSVAPERKPSACAASIWPPETASTPARTTSAMKAAV